MNIKLNWGFGIVVGMLLFMGYIITLSVKMITQKVDLVEKDYYEQGVSFDQKMASIKAANALSSDVIAEINYDNKTVDVVFPKDFNGKKVEGEIYFFRSADASKDKKVKLELNNLTQSYPLQELDRGSWRIQARWTCEGVQYFQEVEISI